MGLKVGTVVVEKYNYNWPEEYLLEKKILLEMFNEIAFTVEHVGSTSVEGLSAKPIIDVAVGVKSLSDFEKVKSLFVESEEYSVKDDSTIGEILIRKGNEDNRTHFIHVMEIDGERYKETMLFRDYLRNNPDEVKNYEDLKIELAKNYSADRTMYTASKNNYIKSVLEKAKHEQYCLKKTKS